MNAASTDQRSDGMGWDEHVTLPARGLWDGIEYVNESSRSRRQVFRSRLRGARLRSDRSIDLPYGNTGNVSTPPIFKKAPNHAAATRAQSRLRPPSCFAAALYQTYPAEQHLIEPLAEGDRQVLVANHALERAAGLRTNKGGWGDDKDQERYEKGQLGLSEGAEGERSGRAAIDRSPKTLMTARTSANHACSWHRVRSGM